MDDAWNTLCLPFGLSTEQIASSPLSEATIMELDGAHSDLTDGTLTLNFNAATKMEAGRPYIVKWPIARVISTPGDWYDFAAAAGCQQHDRYDEFDDVSQHDHFSFGHKVNNIFAYYHIFFAKPFQQLPFSRGGGDSKRVA